MVYLLYDICLWLVLLVPVPVYLLLSAARGKVRRGIKERLGLFDAQRFAACAGRQVLWIHAVSVGETRAAISLIKALRHDYPEAYLLLSNVTETGHAIASEIKEIDAAIYFPVDIALVVRRVLDLVRPSQVLIVETELWPGFIHQCHRRGIPVHLVNGRISDRSYPRYMLVRRLLRPLLAQLTSMCMQSQLDAERILAMGAPPQRVVVTGNIKFDMQSTIAPDVDSARLRDEFAIDSGCRVLVAGSTHAGEEEQIVAVYKRLLHRHADLLLILVPRHPQRCRQVATMLAENELPWRLRSDAAVTVGGGDVLLVDSIGEMLQFYHLADVVFVGGSLVPVGGHNILEAALVRKAVLFGPHMHNFREIAAMITKAQGCGEVRDGEDLFRLLDQLLEQPQRCRTMGEKSWQLLQDNAGASRATLREIARCAPD